MGFVENFVRFLAVQTFWKSVKIWQSYSQLKGGNFFETQCIQKTIFQQNRFNMWQYVVVSAAPEAIKYFVISLLGKEWM